MNLLKKLFYRPHSEPTPEQFSIDLYPPNPTTINAINHEKIIAHYSTLMKQVRLNSQLTNEQFDLEILPAIKHTAAYYHLLPSSQYYHHAMPGGAFHHALETGLLVAKSIEGNYEQFNQQFRIAPSERHSHQRELQKVGFLLGLWHDVGKPISDLCVIANQKQWLPNQQTLSEFLISNNASSYNIRWLSNTTINLHERYTPLIVGVFLTHLKIQMASQSLQTMTDALVDNEHFLSKLVKKADKASVAKSLDTSDRIAPSRAIQQAQQYVRNAVIERFDTINNLDNGSIFYVKSKHESELEKEYIALKLSLLSQIIRESEFGDIKNQDVYQQLLHIGFLKTLNANRYSAIFKIFDSKAHRTMEAVVIEENQIPIPEWISPLAMEYISDTKQPVHKENITSPDNNKTAVRIKEEKPIQTKKPKKSNYSSALKNLILKPNSQLLTSFIEFIKEIYKNNELMIGSAGEIVHTGRDHYLLKRTLLEKFINSDANSNQDPIEKLLAHAERTDSFCKKPVSVDKFFVEHHIIAHILQSGEENEG